MQPYRRRYAIALASAACLVALTGMQSDVYALSTCSGTYTTNQALTADIACDNMAGITLTSGADLDLAGHEITCNSNCPTYAINIAASGSVVKSTSTTSPAITGFFTAAINCNSFSSSEVTGIHFAMVGGDGLINCAKVHNNIIEGNRTLGSVGVSTTGVAATDFITDNWIGEWDTGISVTTSHDIDIEHNQIDVEDVSGSSGEVGANVTRTGGQTTLDYNFFFGGATSASFMQTSGTLTKYGNACDPANTTCQTCSDCRGFSIPF